MEPCRNSHTWALSANSVHLILPFSSRCRSEEHPISSHREIRRLCYLKSVLKSHSKRPRWRLSAICRLLDWLGVDGTDVLTWRTAPQRGNRLSDTAPSARSISKRREANFPLPHSPIQGFNVELGPPFSRSLIGLSPPLVVSPPLALASLKSIEIASWTPSTLVTVMKGYITGSEREVAKQHPATQPPTSPTKSSL